MNESIEIEKAYAKIEKCIQINKSMSPNIEDIFSVGRYYHCEIIKDLNSAMVRYRIFSPNSNFPINLFAKEIQDEMINLSFSVISKADLINEEISEDNLMEIIAKEEFDEDNNKEKNKGDLSRIMDMIDKKILDIDNQVNSEAEVIDDFDYARSVDMDYVKYLLYEIKEKDIESFINIYELIKQSNRDLI